MFYAWHVACLLWVKRTTMKKVIFTLSTQDHVTPAGLLFSFLLGVFSGLMYFAICL